MSSSVDESVKTIKNEILAQDWSVSPKRAAKLKESFDCLKERFKNRQPVHDIFVMADNVLSYITKKKNHYPGSVDFLKAAMANGISLYEDPVVDHERDEEVFRDVHKNFTALKKKLKEIHKKKEPKGAGPGVPPPAAQVPLKTVQVEELSDDERQDMEAALVELQSTMEETQVVAHHQLEEYLSLLEEDGEVEETLTFIEEPSPEPKAPVIDEIIKQCPETKLYKVFIGKIEVGILDSDIAMIEKIEREASKRYISYMEVPLGDFNPRMRSLSGKFKGELSTFKSSKLKETSLPVIVPQSFELPDKPDSRADTVVVVSNGSTHGVILCTSPYKMAFNMVKFQSARDKDISVIGHLEEGDKVSIINIVSILKRKGLKVT